MNLKNLKYSIGGRFVPFLAWIPELKDKTILRADIIAGITVAMVLIPQSMAYASLAGLPPQYGLFAAFLPPMLAAIFGSSRQLATGPVAVVSLMTALAVAPLATNMNDFILYAILLAFMVGCVQLTLGMLRLGVLVNFLSHPVVLGFTNAAAIIIATSQLGKLFGVSVEKTAHSYHFVVVWDTIVAAVQYIHWPTFIMGALAFAIMIFTKRRNARLPYILLAVVVTTIISWATNFHDERTIQVTQIGNENVRKNINEYLETKQKIAALKAQIAKSKEKYMAYSKDTTELSRDANEIKFAIAVISNEKEKLEKHNKALFNNKIKHISFGLTVSKENVSTLYKSSNKALAASFESKGWRIEKLEANKKNGTNDILIVSGGSIVGKVKQGLPGFQLPQFDFGIMGSLFTMAIMIALIGFMEAISIAKAMASRTRQRLDANQELVGQGISNIAGSMFQSYPTSGSFSRSAINISAGAVTGFSSVVTTIVVTITLLFLTPLLYNLPTATLAAVIMVAVFGLINVEAMKHAWHASRDDGVVALVTFSLTLIFAPHLEKGIVIGVSLSLILFLLRTMKPRVVFLSRHKDGSLRDAKAFDLETCNEIAILRFEGSLYFANTAYMEDMVQRVLPHAPDLKFLIIDGVSMNHVDATGEETIRELTRRMNSIGITILFARMKKPILDTLEHTNLISDHGRELFFRKIDLALAYAWEKLGDEHEHECPLGMKIHARKAKEMEEEEAAEAEKQGLAPEAK